MSLIYQLTSSQLHHAANLKEKITSLEKELSAILVEAALALKTPAAKPAKRKVG